MEEKNTIILNGVEYKLTDYRVEAYNAETGEYLFSGLEFKHNEPGFDDLLAFLWNKHIETRKLK